MIEDGQAGGHHSWESLDELLLATYADLRHAGVVLCVGGGLGDPEVAASYLDGSWALAAGRYAMPVDGVFIGTPLMASREAATNSQVKRLLVETPGIEEGTWVRRGEVRGGMTSGLSQLHADIYEVANASAACSRLLAEVGSDERAIAARRDEIVEALSRTAKPYFGDIEEMTYRRMLERYVELAYPWVDESIGQRFAELLDRVEGRLCEADHGAWPSVFDGPVDDPAAAIEKLAAAYPKADTLCVTPADAAFFVDLTRKYPKPVPFVPVIDADISRRWASDTLWQSHDPRYAADAVRIIPGPVSVAWSSGSTSPSRRSSPATRRRPSNAWARRRPRSAASPRRSKATSPPRSTSSGAGTSPTTRPESTGPGWRTATADGRSPSPSTRSGTGPAPRRTPSPRSASP